jgi:myo-inositol 2-dehydrogenase / D-chiro-inositol 1-dehydrogenase
MVSTGSMFSMFSVSEPNTDETEPMRIGIIGAGWIAQTHLDSIAHVPAAEVAAVADVDLARASRAADKAGATPYADWNRLLDEQGDELDAVVVCTPPQHHREPAVTALEQGLPVYLEKPIARTQADAAAIVEVAERTGVLCAIGYQWHSLAAVERIRAELSGQQLGLLVGRSLGPTLSRPWVLRRAEGGGQLLERASHHIDLQRMIAGDVSAVYARAGAATLADRGRSDADIEDVLGLELAYESGASGAIHVAWLRSGMRGIYDLTIAASDALLTLTLDPDFSLTGSSRDHELHEREDRRPALAAMIRFLDAARGGQPDARLCRPADAATTLAVALACERSLESGHPVAVEPSGGR